MESNRIRNRTQSSVSLSVTWSGSKNLKFKTLQNLKGMNVGICYITPCNFSCFLETFDQNKTKSLKKSYSSQDTQQRGKSYKEIL